MVKKRGFNYRQDSANKNKCVICLKPWYNMSRKRKINLRDFDYRSCKDAEEKKFCVVDDINEVRDRDRVGVSDFDVFSTCEALSSDSSGCIVSKDDVVNIVDELNVNHSDLLFTNPDSCNYEYILTENDLLNSVSENTNFYNESVTLYSSNGENGILFDNSFERESSNSLESMETNVSQGYAKTGMLTNTANTEIISMAENLENIVPNLCINMNNDVTHNNYSSESEVAEMQYEHCDKNSGINIVMNNESNLCLNKSSVNNFTPEEDCMLNEFLYFKEGEINSNINCSIYNNNINKKIENDVGLNSSLINSLANIFGPSSSFKNLKVFPLRYVKQNGTSTNKLPVKITTDLLGKTAKVGNLKKLVNIKNIGSLKFNLKQPQLSSNDLKKIISSIKNKKVPLVKYEDLIKSQNKKKPVIILEEAEVSKLGLGNVDKSVQTINNCIFYSDINEVIQSEKNKNNENNFSNKDVLALDRIKKPEPFNKLFLFTFAVNIRSSLCSVLTQEDFLNNNEKISYYTGIPQYSYFMALLNILNLPNNNTILPFQMLLLTLMKIRLNLDWVDLAYRFGRSVQVAKDAFGITVYILSRCLSKLVNWPLQEVNRGDGFFRSSKSLYVFSIKLNSEFSTGNNTENGSKIFICLSNSGHPIHFISKPISVECNDRIAILQSSGIINDVVQNDIIIFDKNTNYSSVNEEWSTVLLVLSKSRDSFCTQLYNDTIQKDVEKMKKTVSQIKKYKFLFENITCDWVNMPFNEYTLFTDVVKVVCGLINLCDVLPFSNCTVKRIISERRSMKIMLT